MDNSDVCEEAIVVISGSLSVTCRRSREGSVGCSEHHVSKGLANSLSTQVKEK